MTKFGKTILVLVVLAIIGGGIAYIWKAGAPATPGSTATTTPDTTGTNPDTSKTLYTNTDLGFSFSYPKTFSIVPQNFMDTTGAKTLILLANADKSQTIHVSVLRDAKTGKPISSDIANYEKALIANTTFDGSGANPKSFSEFSLKQLGDARFAYIKTGLFEGVLGVDYYAAVPGGIVRFSETSQGVDWTNPSFDPEQDAGHLALKSMLATFKVGAYGSVTPPVTLTAYKDPSGAYTVNVPAGWTVNKKFTYDALGPGKSLSGVSFAIPASFTAATNLSSDSYISIEKMPGAAASCTADAFVSTGVSTPDAKNVTVNGNAWNLGQSADTAAGNLYQERVYAAKYGSDCYGIRLFTHSGQVANYDAGARQQFDLVPLQAIHDQVVASFQFSK